MEPSTQRHCAIVSMIDVGLAVVAVDGIVFDFDSCVVMMMSGVAASGADGGWW